MKRTQTSSPWTGRQKALSAAALSCWVAKESMLRRSPLGFAAAPAAPRPSPGLRGAASARPSSAAAASSAPQVLAAAAASLAVLQGPSRRRAAAATRRAVEDAGLEEAKAAVEAAKLELEAAKVRAEIEDMEKATLATRRESRGKALLGSADSLSLEDLRKRIKEVEDLDFSESQVQVLAAKCGKGAELTAADLGSEPFAVEFERIVVSEREAQMKKMVEDRQKETEARKQEQGYLAAERGEIDAPPVPTGEAAGNDDREGGTRLLACLPYLMTLGDAFRFVIPLVQAFPFVGVMLAPIAIVSIVLNVLPFGSLFLFLIFFSLAQNKDVPRLVRFNLEQAVLLDLVQLLPTLVISGLTVSGGNEFVPFVGTAVYLLLFVIVIYCIGKNLQGEDPDGVPIISTITRNVIDQNSFDPDDGKQKK